MIDVTMQTRLRFEKACRLFISKYDSVLPSFSNTTFRGWCWNEYNDLPSFGYMSRSTALTVRLSTRASVVDDAEQIIDEAVDEASLRSPGTQTFACRQYVVYSATFQVPCLYFTISHSNGTPLSADELVHTSLFHSATLDSTTTTSFAVTHPSSLFPLLSQGDHPSLGTPCWYLHPCETVKSMQEVLAEDKTEMSKEERLVRWLEVWFLVIGNMVDLRV
ncbi:hypothetical protein E1B28_004438 [Marasmius oreades]|uniref:Ubiquitin-like-conjugating enzyme ATG10 n=1 Tax=Marasmius oreades TaxID=181124 RepID=A0A9P8ACY9_9AGAR|nr:uncharacterized protein E1B28_004438 [Marasmius oreades]KAG7097047.1 hypothetical protein E1B28_004438 [Marasmius oreades]